MADEPVVQEKKSSFDSKMIIIVVGVLIAAMLTAMGATYFVLNYLNKGGAGPSGPAVVEQVPGKVMPGESFVINLADPGKKYYLKTTIAVEVKYDSSDDKEFADVEYAQKWLPAVKDRIIYVLRGKELADLQAVDGMNNVKKEILKSLNQTIPGDHFQNIYITEWVLQF